MEQWIPGGEMGLEFLEWAWNSPGGIHFAVLILKFFNSIGREKGIVGKNCFNAKTEFLTDVFEELEGWSDRHLLTDAGEKILENFLNF